MQQSHGHWGKGFSVDARYEMLQFRLDHSAPGFFGMSGLVDSNDRLVASLKRYYSRIRVGDRVVLSVGLGAIYTEDSQRKAGWAAQLIQQVLDESRDQMNCELAYLFSDIGTEYYGRFGFQRAPGWTESVSVADVPVGAAAGPKLGLRSTNFKDLLFLLSAYETHTSKFRLRFERDIHTWGFFREINQVGQDHIITCDGVDVGVVSMTPVSTTEGYLGVDEWLLTDTKYEADLLTFLANWARGHGLSKVRGWYLPSAAQIHKQREERPREIPMIASLGATLQVTTQDLSQAYFSGVDHI